MSSFKESFTKDDSKASLLDYDDGAFYFYLLTVLLSVGTVWTIKLGYSVFWRKSSLGKFYENAKKSKLEIRSCTCRWCREKNQGLEGGRRGLFCVSDGTIYHTLALAALWMFVAYICAFKLQGLQNAMPFDPFAILQIPAEATEKEIKKAFRKMSLKFHPDKNPNDATAAAKFVLISKAYQALTDEVAKKNFEKYGNPDGMGMMKVGIGLPRFLVDESSQIFILAAFSIVILVVVPAAFILYYQRLKEYLGNGLRKDTVQTAAGYMGEMISPQQVLMLVAASGECRSIPYRPTDAEELKKVKESVKTPPPELLFKHPKTQKAVVLLCAHLQRKTSVLPPNLRKDLDQVLKYSMAITRGMIDIAYINNWLFTIQAIVVFRRSLIQALEIGAPPPMQMPHTTPERAINVLRAAQQFQPKDFAALLDMVQTHEKVVMSSYTQSEKDDVAAYSQSFPRITIDAKVVVEDEQDIAIGDVGQCVVKFTRTHLKDNEIQGPVHAPHFPGVRHEEWFIIVADPQANQFHGIRTIKSMEREVEVSVPFLVQGPPGVKKVIVIAYCDSYFGADKSLPIQYTALPADAITQKGYIHPEDIALDDQPSLLQQMVGTLVEEEESSDDEE